MSREPHSISGLREAMKERADIWREHEANSRRGWPDQTYNAVAEICRARAEELDWASVVIREFAKRVYVSSSRSRRSTPRRGPTSPRPRL